MFEGGGDCATALADGLSVAGDDATALGDDPASGAEPAHAERRTTPHHGAMAAAKDLGTLTSKGPVAY